MLHSNQPTGSCFLSSGSRQNVAVIPDLQSSRSQNPCFLVFCHVGCSNALVIRNLLLFVRFDAVFGCSRRIARYDHVVGVFVAVLQIFPFLRGFGLILLLDILVIVVGLLTVSLDVSDPIMRVVAVYEINLPATATTDLVAEVILTTTVVGHLLEGAELKRQGRYCETRSDCAGGCRNAVWPLETESTFVATGGMVAKT